MTANALTAQLLAWLAERPRSYGETMEAWRTTCPPLTIWEDAGSDGLGAVEGAGPMRDARVHVTQAGEARRRRPWGRRGRRAAAGRGGAGPGGRSAAAAPCGRGAWSGGP